MKTQILSALGFLVFFFLVTLRLQMSLLPFLLMNFSSFYFSVFEGSLFMV